MQPKPLKAYKNPDFLNSREARPLRILSEYLEPEKRFRELDVQHTIVFFGSARVSQEIPNSPSGAYYGAAEEFAYGCARLSQTILQEMGERIYICTGGGPGIMEAANRGACRAEDKSIGLNISLPFEQESNDYITKELNFEFHYFFTRKLWFLYHAKAIAVFPGGFGTMDELFETLTLVQTQKLIKVNIPILLYDRSFWDKIINFQGLVDYGMIDKEDLGFFHFFDSPEEGLAILEPGLRDVLRFYQEHGGHM